MGPESGGGGGVPQSINLRGRPPEIRTILVTFFLPRIQILHFQHFHNKVGEIRGGSNFLGGWVSVLMNRSPNQNWFLSAALY